MKVVLLVMRYPVWFSWAGVFSMALFRLPLMLSKHITFYKLMGTGKNGGFDAVPDPYQWSLLICLKDGALHRPMIFQQGFIGKWLQWFKVKHWWLVMEPTEGIGKWDGKEVFGKLPRQSAHEGITAVLTRATIRLSKAKAFWKNVKQAAQPLQHSPGFIYSLGIGEMPWIKQATFSIWLSKQHMKEYAYKMQQHREVITKTRKQKWYSEEMFVRFRVAGAGGDVPAGLGEWLID